MWAVLVCVLLHLPAHFAPGAGGREALYEDGPAFVSNAAFEPYGTETLKDVVVRAATRPEAAWSSGDGSATDDTVGRSRFRPVSQALLAVQHGVFRGAPLATAGVISLLLHICTVLATLSLLRSLRASAPTQWLAVTVVAASPVALAAAAWPARQAIVVATAAGVAACALAVRGGFLRQTAAAILVVVSASSHELGFGAGLAAILLSRRADDGAPRMPWAAATGLAAAIAIRIAGRAPLDAATPAGPVAGPLDGAVGIVHAAVSLVLPARVHFADGMWLATGPAAAVAVVVLALGGWALVAAARRGSSAGLLGLSALAAALPVLGLGAGGVSGAPYHDGLLYAVAPFAASALAWVVTATVARGGSLRTAAALAGATWVGANVVATAERAPAFRTREAHVALAENEMPDSPVVAAWRIDLDAAKRATGDAETARVRDLADRASRLASRITADGAPALAADAVAARTIASSLARASAIVTSSEIPPGDDAHDASAAAARAATVLTPAWTRAWVLLAAAEEKVGALQAAYDAAAKAAEMAPHHPEVLATGTGVSLRLGRVGFAAAVAENLYVAETTAAKAEGRKVRPEILLLFARAMSADGASRVPDPFGETGMRYRYEVAIEILSRLASEPTVAERARVEMYRACLHYGDVLVSVDRPALALLAYGQAIQTKLPDPEAEEHAKWLDARLAADEAAAAERLSRAARAGEGSAADALVDLAIAKSRRGRWKEAEEIFARLEEQQGAVSPELRYHRALAVLREPDPRAALGELRQVVRDAPDLARAWFEAAKLEEELGEYPRALESFREARRLAELQAATGGAEEWLLEADERFEGIEAFLRNRDASR